MLSVAGKRFSDQYLSAGTWLLCLILVCLGERGLAQRSAVLRAKDLGPYNQVFLNDSLWLFHPGDQAPAVSTAGWDTLHHTIFGKSDVPQGWKGIGWFGLWIRADTGLVDRKLFIRINHDGASEIYVDGKPIGGYGKVGTSAERTEAIERQGK